MSSLSADIRRLEEDLTADPTRISAYHDLPFAILRYDAEEEWDLRREARRLAVRLDNAGKRVHTISLADLLWEAIDDCEGLDAVVELERERGFEVAQQQVTTYLSDPDWRPLPDILAERLEPLDPERDVAFLVRASAMAPAHLPHVPAARRDAGQDPGDDDLFYPGTPRRDHGA